jgi:hypothetical protein
VTLLDDEPTETDASSLERRCKRLGFHRPREATT